MIYNISKSNPQFILLWFEVKYYHLLLLTKLTYLIKSYQNSVNFIMTYLQAIAISGFRSYSEDQIQKVQFQEPLTLIWGSNGSGKTTIIEALKFMTTGSLPPNSNSGKSFIMDPKIANKAQIIADARIRFTSFNKIQVIAKRRILLSSSSKGLKFESIEQSLKSKSKEGQICQINHQCAQIQKQISQIIGISKPILQNISFCHQEESLWPFSDSSTLKLIFDELFQTTKYAKIIQNFQDVQKEYAKELKQLKKDIAYFRNVYDEDKKRKINCLKEMRKMGDQCDQIQSSKMALQKMEAENQKQNISLQEFNEKKFDFLRKKGGFQEIMKRNDQEIKKLVVQMTEIDELYYKLNRQELQLVQDNQQAKLAQIPLKIQKLMSDKKELESLFEQTKNLSILNQKQMEISTQINRIRQIMPELKKVNLSNHDILERISLQKDHLEGLKKQCLNLRQKRQKFSIPRLFQLSLDQKTYKINKHLFQQQQLNLQETKHSILTIYNHLHRPIEHSSSLSSFPKKTQNVQQKMKKIRLNLKIKRQQLQKYKNMPYKQSLKDRKFMLQFAGIDYYERLYHFCEQKHKCWVCSKEMNQGELVNLRTRLDKNKKLTQVKLKALALEEEEDDQNDFNPEELIRILEKQIIVLEGEEQECQKEYLQYKIEVERRIQEQLNFKLDKSLKKIGLEPQKESNNQKNIDCTLQNFMELLNIYQNTRYSLQMKSVELKNYEQKSRKNLQISKQIGQIQINKRQLQSKLSQNELQLQNYELVRITHEKLTDLLKVKVKLSKNKANIQANPTEKQRNITNIQQSITKITKQIKLLSLQQQYYDCFIKKKHLFKQNQDIQQNEVLLTNQLAKIDFAIKQHSFVNEKYNQLRIEYESKRRQVDLKGDMYFNQYNKKPQIQYLLKNKKIGDLQQACKEIQSICKAMEETINETHQMKMEEVNQILSEIWKQVYHGTDIKKIEIQATYESSTKRRKNYLYNIMMEKQNKAKIEMRGRCSMGQKVLASILIRLAIAETFTQSACILTLDQPTTNLDRSHIDSLAIQLGRLIQLNNFSSLQLIIISHDLQFIRRLQKYTNCYHQVWRNHKNFSQITKKDIQELCQSKR